MGLSYEFLRPAPQYAINPFYWLGALAVVAFVIQAVSGMLMMLYYVPDPSQAYQSTQYIFSNVSYGTFLETVHLYTAYAMILLVFMHMMRGYFVSVHKKPRELMWVAGMAMGFVTLGLGFTGYLLPWTVVSKSATDVGAGMISALPQPLSSFLSFLAIGSGGDAAELLRFFDLHVIVLPAILLVLLVVKMYMMETHGISERVTGPEAAEKSKLVPIFPDVSFYLAELAALFGAAMLLFSVLFPLGLQPGYTATAASHYTNQQPDWYFLWIYQLIKISAFETAGLPVALTAVTLIFVALLLLPFLDRGRVRRIEKRPFYVTLGLVFVAEVAVLTAWGYLTPGEVIPNEQAALVLGGTALAVVVISLLSYRLIIGRLVRRMGAAEPHPNAIRSSGVWTAAAFAFLLGAGSLALGSVVNSFAGLVSAGGSVGSLAHFAVLLGALATTVMAIAYLLYRVDLATGAVRRHLKAFEVGWNE
jgi:quinol-cytochrome oxidoreductase complex cytochrome b subunit